MKNNPLAFQILRCINKKQDGKITFVEFMESIAHLSQAGKEADKFQFGFDFYDHDRDGFITP